MSIRSTRRAAACALLLAAGSTQASELVYQPVNPNFGGYPANGANLLSQANATFTRGLKRLNFLWCKTAFTCGSRREGLFSRPGIPPPIGRAVQPGVASLGTMIEAARHCGHDSKRPFLLSNR